MITNSNNSTESETNIVTSDEEKSETDSSQDNKKLVEIRIHPEARKYHALIEKKLLNINPVTKIVEPAFGKMRMKQPLKIVKYTVSKQENDNPDASCSVLNKHSKKQKKQSSNSIINANPAIKKEKISKERNSFVNEVYNKFSSDTQLPASSDYIPKLASAENKKGRKLRKNYTLPPKPVKLNNALYDMEIKKYEAAKYYLINQNKTTLAKTSKKFNVSVPTLITYMDKDRVDTYLKTGKYSGNSAKRERRNIKNQYQEKNQKSDKWMETIKGLIKEAPLIDANDVNGKISDFEGHDTTKIDNATIFIEQNIEAARSDPPNKTNLFKDHLAQSKQIMKNTEMKLKYMISQQKSHYYNTFKSTGSNNTAVMSSLDSHQSTALPPLRLPLNDPNNLRNFKNVADSFQKKFDPSNSKGNFLNVKSQSTNNTSFIDFSRPPSNFYPTYRTFMPLMGIKGNPNSKKFEESVPKSQHYHSSHPEFEDHSQEFKNMFAHNNINTLVARGPNTSLKSRGKRPSDLDLSVHSTQYNQRSQIGENDNFNQINQYQHSISPYTAQTTNTIVTEANSNQTLDTQSSAPVSSGSYTITPPNSKTVEKDKNNVVLRGKEGAWEADSSLRETKHKL